MLLYIYLYCRQMQTHHVQKQHMIYMSLHSCTHERIHTRTHRRKYNLSPCLLLVELITFTVWDTVDHTERDRAVKNSPLLSVKNCYIWSTWCISLDTLIKTTNLLFPAFSHKQLSYYQSIIAIIKEGLTLLAPQTTQLNRNSTTRQCNITLQWQYKAI